MGSLEPESKQTFSVMESGHEGGTSSESKIQQTATSPKVTPSKELSSSLSSSGKELTGISTGPHIHNKDAQLASDFNEEDFPISSQSKKEQPNDGLYYESTTEFPPTQVMARTDDSNSPDASRIPPHVFARTKSNAPVEWSVASNESLFSIHMGNMSFTRDHASWIGKSGELGLIGENQFSGPLIDLPSMQPPTPPTNISTEHSMRSGNLNQGLGATEAAAAETMREVIRENAADNSEEKLFLPKKDPRSLGHDASTKSFAFPILAGDVEKSRSLKGKKHQQSQPETPRGSEPPTPKPQTPKAIKNDSQAKWYSCFCCCSFC